MQTTAQSGQWNHKRVLVTGGTGFIGRHLVKRLVKEGADVTLFVLDEETTAPHFLPIYRGNLINLQDIHRCVLRTQPEYVFHLASQPLVGTALRGVMDTLNSNIVGGMNLLHSCLDAASLRSIVYVTTDKVYGDSNGADENEPLNGVNHPYNVSKVCADVLAQMYGRVFDLPIGIARSGNVYGGGDLNFDRIIPYACRQVLRGEQIVLRSDGSYRRDYLYIDDMIDGYLMLAKKVEKQEIRAMNFGSEKTHSVVDVLSTVFSSAGARVEIVHDIDSKHELHVQHLNWGLARQVLGWRPQVSFEEGIKRTYQWYEEYFNERR